MLQLRKRIESRLEKGLKLWIVIFFGIDFNSGKLIKIIELYKILIKPISPPAKSNSSTNVTAIS
jgi:hypothetical protein